ncbi:MAG: EAL domain-containing protein [Actinobacteria bacterium]|nr:EAL domain-containing protein [Actinomycetota bacterium]MCA1721381.1 EAL domain-containing protein [Actinomycetota bacterium]
MPHAVRLPRTRLSRLDAYVYGVIALAAGVTVYVLLGQLPGDLELPQLSVLVFAALLVVGESQPIVISRGDDDLDEVTIASIFIMALVVLGPAWLLLLAQICAVTFDDVRRRKNLKRLLFNNAQLVLSGLAARAVFCLMTQRTFAADSMPMQVGEVLPALAAGAVFFILNNGLTGVVVALALDKPIVPHLKDDARFQLSTSGVLLAFAPVVIVATDFSLLLVPLMMLPIFAVHRSARLAAERERQALHDGLTGLPNRLMIQDRASRAIEDGARSGASTAVLLIDLDHFKEINDTLGHYVGDQLLRQVANRLRDSLREGDTVARLGGDEFAILACDLGTQEDAEQVARRVVDGLMQPFTIDGVRLDVQASVGIALCPDHGDDVSTLMQRADVALYAAKEHRGTFAFYSPEGDLHSVEKLALLGELREGVSSGQLVVHYQPKCDAGTGVLVGLEALVRWQHPVRGLIFPDDFVPIAENTGLIGALTLEVLDQSLEMARSLRDTGHPMGVAVNISVRCLTDLELPRQVAGLLGRWGVPPEALTLEVTETSIMVDPTRTMTVLGLLRDLGVSLSIDDFGTGYSSLAYLKRLEANELKIDKSFVFAMSQNSNDAVIVRSTIELGHNLGLRLVAEGVEDAETWAMLKALGCDVIQGYHLSRPLDTERVRAWIRDYQRPLATVTPLHA